MSIGGSGRHPGQQPRPQEQAPQPKAPPPETQGVQGTGGASGQPPREAAPPPTGATEGGAAPHGPVPPGFEVTQNQQGIPVIEGTDQYGQTRSAIWTTGLDGEGIWDGGGFWVDGDGVEHQGHYPAGRTPKKSATQTQGSSGPTDTPVPEKGNRPGPEKGNAG